MTFQQDPDRENIPQALAEPQPTLEAEPHPPREPWRLRDLLLFLGFIAVAFVIVLILSVAVSVAYIIFAPLVGWTTPLYSLQQNTIYLLTFQLIWYAILLAYIYFLVAVHYRLPFWKGLQWKTLTGHSLVRFFLGGAVLSMVVMLVPPFLPEKKGFPLEKMFSSPGSAYAIALFAVLIAPFMEELLFRGLLFAFFEKHGGITFAVVSTALLFAGLHIPEYWGAWQSLAMLLVVGVVFSVVRGMTRSVTPSYILHMTYNGTQMLILYFQTQHFHKFPGVPHL
jgi:membrane protease YdiL (CAAX protease family)